MLEREPDLAACRMALDGAVHGRGRYLVIEGPAGIGKTSLLRVFLDTVSGARVRVLSARATELERDLPFGAVRQLFEPILSGTGRRGGERPFRGAATVTRQLFTSERVGAGTSDPYAMLHGLYWVTSELAEQKPLVLAIDDAHWLDDPTVRFLSFLQPRLVEMPVLVVLATRPLHDEPDDEGLARIRAEPETCLVRPQPLSRRAVASMVREQVGQTSDETVHEFAAVTGGNPFYVVELLRDVKATRSTDPASLRRLGPRSIAQAIRFRGRGSSNATAFARALAVLGDGARIQDVIELAQIDLEGAPAVADAMTADAVLGPGPDLAFAHPIIRTAVYEDIGPREREAMHKRAARLIASGGADVDRVAVHLLATHPEADPWAVQQLRTAADAARHGGAPDVAVRYLRRALAEPPERAIRPTVLLELGRAEESIGSDQAATHFAEAYEAVSTPMVRAQAAVAAAFAFAAGGDSRQSIDMLEAAANHVDKLAPDAALELEAQIAIMAAFQAETATRHLARLDRIDADQLAGTTTGEQLMLCVLGYRRMWRGDDADRAAWLVERGLTKELVEQQGSEALELNAAGLTLILADRHAPAEELIRQLMRVARETGSRWGYGLTSFLRASLGNRRGNLIEAESAARVSVDLARGSGQPVLGSVAAGELVVALAERGAFAEAHRELEVLGLDHDLPGDPMYAAVLSARGRMRTAQGDARGGLADLQDCGRRRELQGNASPLFLPWLGDAATACRALGDSDQASELAERQLGDARRWGTAGAIGAAQRVMGLVAPSSETIEWLRAANESLEASPARLEHAKALVELGSALRRASHRHDAREPLTRGLDLADRCGARPLAERARSELAAIGVRARRARLSGVEALTASEHRVAQMAAEGMTNVEIAQTLFVTRKTVEKHLGNAYGKLGVTSRAALAPYLLAGEHAAGGPS